MAIKNLNLINKPREKGQVYGFDQLTDAELLAILLRTGTRHLSALQLAQQILEKAEGRLENIFAQPLEALLKIPGIGLGKGAIICACYELAKRIPQQTYEQRPALKEPQDVVRYLLSRYQNSSQEELRGLYLDTKKNLLKDKLLSKGGLNFAHLTAREIFLPALEAHADTFILVHNHPSGDPTPSPDDKQLTQMVQEMGKVLKIHLIDHIILGHKSYFSFAQKGELL